MKLDRARLALLDSASRWVVVQAFAGAGKTRLAIEIASRFCKLPGLLPGQRILFVSFSTASGMRAWESLRGSGIASHAVHVCTFHSLALALVRRYSARLGHRGPIRPAGNDTTGGTHLSFDDLVASTIRLLGDADIAALVAESFPLVIVDEYQDTSVSLLDILRAGFVQRSVVRCFGDSNQRIQPGALDFDAHSASIATGAEEHFVDPIQGSCRYHDSAIEHLARAFRDGTPYRCVSEVVGFLTVPSEGEPLAHALCWGLLKTVNAGRSAAVICFSNTAVGTLASLLAAKTEKRPGLPVRAVTSQEVLAAQDAVYIALLNHWCDPSAENKSAVIQTLARLSVGGDTQHRHYRSRLRQLETDLRKSKLPDLPLRGAENGAQDPSRLVDWLSGVAGALADAVQAKWSSASWATAGLRGAAWRLSQTLPDGLDLRDDRAVERIARAWDQARRWRGVQAGKILVMTVNQAKNREFDDVVVFVDSFQNQLRGPITASNRMQMYVAVSRACRSVKIVCVENNNTKPSALLLAVLPGPNSR